ncbi:hypothetical protein F5X97DRAFT_224920 [Nemania serpens]|nr:hypothetical protein F5X97DRAFT_224920 [Nemania serpens]
MSGTPPPGMPDQVGSADYYRAIVNRIQQFENSPAFTDPDIGNKLNKHDELTDAINNLKNEMIQSFGQLLRDEIKSVRDDFRGDIRSVRDDIRSVRDDVRSVRDDVRSVRDDVRSVRDDIRSVRDDVRSVRDDVRSVRDDIRSVRGDIRSVRDDIRSVRGDIKSVRDDIKSVKADINEDIKSVREEIKSTKEDPTESVDALRKSLRINIATCDTNSITGGNNVSGNEIAPFCSVRTGAPIEGFPKTINELAKLSKPQIIHILTELDDGLVYDANNATVEETRDRLAMLIGVQGPRPM